MAKIYRIGGYWESLVGQSNTSDRLCPSAKNLAFG